MSGHTAQSGIGTPPKSTQPPGDGARDHRLLVGRAGRRHRLAGHLAGHPPVRQRVGHDGGRAGGPAVPARRRTERRPRDRARRASLGAGALQRAVPGLRGDLLRRPRGHVRRPGRHARLPVPARRRVVDGPGVPGEAGQPDVVDRADLRRRDDRHRLLGGRPALRHEGLHAARVRRPLGADAGDHRSRARVRGPSLAQGPLRAPRQVADAPPSPGRPHASAVSTRADHSRRVMTAHQAGAQHDRHHQSRHDHRS